jgi:hypothetical protein
MSKNSLMVVAKKYKLLTPISIVAGTFDKKGQKEFVHKKIVPRQFVEDRNSHNNNELYVIDEEATKEMILMREEELKKNEIKKAKENVSMSDLVTAIAGNSESQSYPDDEPNKDWTVKQLKAYCKDNGIKFHHKAKEAKLLELINS